MSKKWCETNQADQAGRPPQGHREHGLVQGQRHRPVPRARAPAERAHRLRAQRQLLGQDRRQRAGSHLHADRQPRDARRGAGVRRGRRDGAGAGAGHRAHQRQPQRPRDRRPRAAHHLPGHGPEARRAAVLQRQGQEPVQGQARAPGLLPGHRHRRHPAHRDARRLAPDRADGRPRHQRLGPPSRTSACRTTSKPPRSCWPTPAIRTASRSR